MYFTQNGSLIRFTDKITELISLIFEIFGLSFLDFFENVLGDATKTEKESEVASLFPVRPFRSVFVFSPLNSLKVKEPNVHTKYA